MMMNEDKRLQYWAALTVFSIVSLSSMTNFFDDNQDLEREQKWSISVASVSLILAVLSFFLRMLMTKMFAEKFMEHGAVLVVLGFWCGGLPIINNSSNYLSVGTNGAIFNVNLFFSSWMAFIVSMMLFADMFPSMLMGDKVTKFTNQWIWFGAASLIVMTNAVWYWRDNNCTSVDDSNMCHRDLFGFVLGAVSGLVALVFMALAFMAFNHERLEQLVSILLTAAWCFGIAYLTFDDGPAQFVGTFYFSIWFSFMFAFWMAVHAVISMYSDVMESDETVTPEEGKGAQETTAKQDVEEHEKEEVVQEGDV
ncbi:hypothetical protein IV203_016871 [Nitzschia inconspicua]|uniref:Transmembrane protein n=1 Tax=Nitzschia inconspicua TaxID=303405 RepID=A0A9K3KRH1_9STRA|nr:hypothetical protein IV203_016871 [Nitzschia inconspicua]